MIDTEDGNNPGSDGADFTENVIINPENAGEIKITSNNSGNGEELVIEAIANEGWRFTEWSGEISERRNPASITLDRDITLIAEFDQWERDNVTTVNPVTSPRTGRVWMDRNLGASRVAVSASDQQAYGHFYQWGRAADGHQRRNSQMTTELSVNDKPGHALYIFNADSIPDWRSPQNDSLWQGVNGINNPCPEGYRIPTHEEWRAEFDMLQGMDVAAGSFLRIPAAGGRNETGIYNAGDIGRYYTSNINTTPSEYHKSYYFEFRSTASIVSGNVRRSTAVSVRCIQHES